MKLNILRLLRTLFHLKPIQIYYQLKVRVFNPSFNFYKSCSIKLRYNDFLIKNKSLNLDSGEFTFLNIKSRFYCWSNQSNGMLWVYNLNYMDWLLQKDISFEEGAIWIDKFIKDLPKNQVGLDAYPIALRGVNWIKFISLNYNKIAQEKIPIWNNSLYSQYKLLEKKIEYHLLGNHLLEDAYSLFIASLYFNNKSFYKKSKKILVSELNEQILPDGAHFEQSPMYHCILLDRLLDCYNFSINNVLFDSQFKLNSFIRSKAIQMLGHLESIIYIDGSFPLFNDSAEGVAPIPKDIFSYAKRLGLIWKPLKLKECGYRKMKSTNMEAFVDIGNITASYQPGHTHSDVLNYELRIKDRPFIVDTGVSTYDKNKRRQYERSSSAHNTVTIQDIDAYEVWDGFRVGRRSEVKVIVEKGDYIKAYYKGSRKIKKSIHSREFKMLERGFLIIDRVNSNLNSVSYIHLHPSVRILKIENHRITTNYGVISVYYSNKIDIVDDYISTEYNHLHLSKVIKIHFISQVQYLIS